MDSYARRLIEIQKYINERKSDGTINAIDVMDMIKGLELPDSSVNISTITGGNNVININNDFDDDEVEEQCDDEKECCIQGPPDQRSQGPKGDKGDKGDSGNGNTVLIHSEYFATIYDYYIGVNSEDPSIIHLPEDAVDGIEIIVKVEMPAPIGNKKVTVDGNGFKIDGKDSVVLQNPYERVHLIFRGNEWHII